ncbi:MAG: oxidative stress defense protein [Methanosaeta sp. PtaB.Bin039]|nr:MAG: oxidative stress defense protein [Methanosaeta sp. PtaB.Bin039]
MMRWLIAIGMVMIVAASAASAESTPSITVMGVGSVVVPADTAAVAISFSSNNQDRDLAVSENAERLNATLKDLKAAGLRDDEIIPGFSSGYSMSQSMIRTSQTVDNNTTTRVMSSNFSGYTTTVMLKVGSADEGRVRTIIDEAEKSGAAAQVTGYYLSDDSAAVAEAKKKARQDAEDRARAEAAVWGFKLGKVLEIIDCDAYGMMGMPLMISMDDPFEQLMKQPSPSGTVEVSACVLLTYETRLLV